MLQDRIVAVCTLLLGGAYLYSTTTIPTLETVDPLGPKPFPYLLCAGLVISAVWLLIETQVRNNVQPVAGATRAEPRGHGLMILAVVLWVAVYFASFERVGFLICTPVFLFGLMAYFNRGKWLANGLTSLLFTLGTYLLFTRILGVSLASGLLVL